MRGSGWAALAGLAALLTGCTTAATGIAVAPPGINRYSFRECLLNNGFYSRQALTGIALRDWHYRHDQPEYTRKQIKSDATRFQLLEQKDGAFIATAARVIADGLMPSDEFWQPDVNDYQSLPDDPKPPKQAAEQELHFADADRDRPYVDLSAPPPYDGPGDADSGKAPSKQPQPSRGSPDARDWRLNRFLDCYVGPVGMQPSPLPSAVQPPSLMPPPTPTPTFTSKPPWAAAYHGDDDLEGRLLRGHILLTLLTQYGTELIVSHPSRKQVAQAELLLGHVKDAETSLRDASLVMNDTLRAKLGDAVMFADQDGTALAMSQGKVTAVDAAGRPLLGADGKPRPVKAPTLTLMPTLLDRQPTLRWFDFTTRLLRVFQVGVDVERIDAEQSLDRASNLIAAFSGSIGGFLPILKDGLAGIATVGKVKIYGHAYLRDARETLALVREHTHHPATAPTAGDWGYDVPLITHSWQLWDNELESACRVLATVAKKDPAAASCLPATAAPARRAARRTPRREHQARRADRPAVRPRHRRAEALRTPPRHRR